MSQIVFQRGFFPFVCQRFHFLCYLLWLNLDCRWPDNYHPRKFRGTVSFYKEISCIQSWISSLHYSAQVSYSFTFSLVMVILLEIGRKTIPQGGSMAKWFGPWTWNLLDPEFEVTGSPLFDSLATLVQQTNYFCLLPAWDFLICWVLLSSSFLWTFWVEYLQTMSTS